MHVFQEFVTDRLVGGEIGLSVNKCCCSTQDPAMAVVFVPLTKFTKFGTNENEHTQDPSDL